MVENTTHNNYSNTTSSYTNAATNINNNYSNNNNNNNYNNNYNHSNNNHNHNYNDNNNHNYNNSNNYNNNTNNYNNNNHNSSYDKTNTSNNYNNNDNNNNRQRHDAGRQAREEQFIYQNLYNVDGDNPPSAATHPSSKDHHQHPTEHQLPERPDISIFMDSNRRHINFDNLFVGKKVQLIPCGTVKYALKAVHDPKFKAPKTAIIHLGTNDINQGPPQDFFKSLEELLDFLISKGTAVFVSELLPRTDGHKPLVDQVNANLKVFITTDPTQTSKLIPHPHISHNHLFDEVHLRHDPIEGEKRSGTQLLAVDLYLSQYGKEPMDSRISRSLKGDQRNQRSRSNSRYKGH